MDCIKKLFVFKFLFLIVLFTSCNESNKEKQNQIQRYDNEICEVSNNEIVIKKRAGNDRQLNGIIYKNLIGKSGTYNVIFLDYKVDYYGNKTETRNRIGTINANELNKFENFRFWETRTGGVTEMISKYYTDKLEKERNL